MMGETGVRGGRDLPDWGKGCCELTVTPGGKVQC